jgi:peptide/nickel transport system permease protein
MARFIARRVLGMIAVLFAISVIVFLIFNVIPNSDPAARIAGKNADPALIARVSADLGLDQPLPVQYLTMMRQIFTGQLMSYAKDRNVVQQIWDGVPATFSLCIGAAVIWMALAVLFGYMSAVHAGKFTDRALTIAALVGISMPVFWLAAILLYFFTFKIQLFPTGSYVPLTEDPLGWAYHLILPWFTLAVLYVGFYSRMLRSNMLDAMNEDYVRTARAKGLYERRVVLKHALRNALTPVITLGALEFGTLLSGAVLTEQIFTIPGFGKLIVDAVFNRDYAVVQGVVLVTATTYIVLNLLADVAYMLVNPRLRG